ncbi:MULTISPECIES: glutathione S-transferase family protein [Azorhizobium]|uniref:Glutathione S-transferase n=1 Tax=Azorhizobium caulinodans (strain ATCC 43989 / DSM 5975 / JCM 20966 / LMG 6465 / NBRC 14845 / NCIMB 13405 / ORS 571) TaxID=438753 RepID=A8I1X2_AZOC5|nr:MULTISPECIES: glutathione S-transferase family protein [Azorhizobium]TDT91388.1 glutathione S-transferase [Azorhizobium sp. AG788]BAF90673.1 glutathione S-transferase [Azorhizobium caulinodans ORS 571]
MIQLYHHPFCPHSRFIRLLLAEYGIEPELIEVRVWERDPDFLALNPANETPVLTEEHVPSAPGASIIAEYLDETRGLALADRRLLPHAPLERIEVRRLVAWFHEKMFLDVTEHLVRERIYKRYMRANQGGGPPDATALRAARSNIRYHLKYIGWLAKARNWLAGERLTHADLAAAAHLSVADYLGDVPWDEDEDAKAWYARVKSRPTFRGILADTMPGMPPSATYTDLDF